MSEPLLTLQQAQLQAQCRICGVPFDYVAMPKGWWEDFNEMVSPDHVILNFGKECAHKACLEKQNNMSEQTSKDIQEVCNEVAAFLIKKNQSYGDSALSPIRVFSKLDAEAGLKVRMDDKLSRLMNGNGEFNEDTEMDLLGYLILMRVARRRKLIKEFTDVGAVPPMVVRKGPPHPPWEE